MNLYFPNYFKAINKWSLYIEVQIRRIERNFDKNKMKFNWSLKLGGPYTEAVFKPGSTIYTM